ncbi:hypothetical protein ACQP1W_01960 [Spirillospora sp. CA-255316]
METQTAAVHRLIVCVDVESFTDRNRTERQRLAVRDGLYEALKQAFDRANVKWRACYHEDRGDGVLILVPPEVAFKERLVVDVLQHLAVALAGHNELHAQGARVRLRIALHAGEIYQDEHGVSGTAANVAFRLLDAKPLKHALAHSAGALAVIASDRIFHDVIRHTPGSRADSYRHVYVSERGTEADAWIGLPDNARPPDLPSARRSRGEESRHVRDRSNPPATQPVERWDPARTRGARLGFFRRGGVRISRTGRATAGDGGKANTGFSGSSVPEDVRIDRTGDAEGGDANTGIESR